MLHFFKSVLFYTGILLGTLPNACAQPYYFRHYQVENGLSNNTVSCILQDRKGFIWMGTKEGLNRFDGYHFKLFTGNKKESILSSDPIYCMTMDQNGIIWVGSQNGIYHYDEDKEQFVGFLDSLREINCIQMDASGQLWMLSRNNLFRYNFTTKTVTSFPPAHNYSYVSLCVAGDGALWLATTDGFLEKFNAGNSNEFCHTWKDDIAKYPAFLDDYAFLIQAFIHLQEITAETKWLIKAKQVTQFVIDNFSEAETGFFYYTKTGQQDVIIRKKEVYDGAVPSGNSVMGYNLYQLSLYFDKIEWKDRSRKMISSLGQAISRHPTSFGIWASLLLEITSGTYEVAILGNNFDKMQMDLLNHYLPHRILMASDVENEEFPLLAGKISPEKPLIYLCKEFACQQPVDSIERFISLINKV